MTTYYGTYGQKVQYLASDPSDPQIGQVWYNSTSAVLKVRSATTAGTFASGGNLGSGGYAFGYAGTQTAALLAGGYTGSYNGNSATYNGTAWTSIPATCPNTAYHGGAGVQTAAIFMGGYNQPTELSVVNYFNGTTFSPQTALPATRVYGGAAGTQTSALTFGGVVGGSPDSNSTLEWDGSSWTTGGNLNTGRDNVGGAGTQTAALAFGGGGAPGPSGSTATELYNGTSWTSNPTGLNSGRGSSAGYGTQSSAGFFGGGPPTNVPVNGIKVEIWNGTTWSTNPNNMPTALNQHRGCGTVAAGLSWGGSPGTSNVTLEFTGPGVAETKTVTVS